ncbi:MAG: hypothetical protein GXP43_02775 [bacterium]|nr:hypothetical protein [bacterium]
MKVFLLLIPIITTLFGLAIYKFQDRNKEIFRLDLIQFVYLFVIAPIFFVWAKTFLFFLLRRELDFNLSVTDLFVIDTIFSVLSFVIISVIAIHSLTKTFRLKRDRDPSFDLFHLSEYFHLWWTHIIMWGGVMVIGIFMSTINILIPFGVANASKVQFYLLLLAGLISGVSFFFAIWMSDAQQNNYMKLMKLFFAGGFIFHVIIYFLVEPKFSLNYGGYWFVFAAFTSAVLVGSVFERYERPRRFRDKLLHVNWGNNINLFGGKK